MIHKTTRLSPPPMPKAHQQRTIQDWNDPDGVYYKTTCENSLNNIRALAGEALYLEFINDKRIPDGETWQGLAAFSRRVYDFLTGHNFSWWTAANMIFAGLQLNAEIKTPENEQVLAPAAAEALENWQAAIRDTDHLADEHRPETSAAQTIEIEAEQVFIHAQSVAPAEVIQ